MEALQEILYKRLKKIKQAYRDYENNPYNPALVHDLRVDTRKLRSIVHFLKHAFGEKEYNRINRELKAFAKTYGRLRELDVLTEVCSTIALRQPDLSEHYYDMFKYLREERNREMKRTFNKTNIEAFNGMLESVEQAIDMLSIEMDTSMEDYITDRLKTKKTVLIKEYEELDMTDYNAVHDVRKRAKKLRYSARYLRPLTGKKHKKTIKRMKKIQNALGNYTDAHVNAELLGQLGEKTKNEELEKLFVYMGRIENHSK